MVYGQNIVVHVVLEVVNSTLSAVFILLGLNV